MGAGKDGKGSGGEEEGEVAGGVGVGEIKEDFEMERGREGEEGHSVG